MLFYSENASAANEFAEAIRLGVENLGITHEQNNAQHLFTISIGMVSTKNNTQDTHKIYQQADNLLYQVKQSGRNNLLSNII